MKLYKNHVHFKAIFELRIGVEAFGNISADTFGETVSKAIHEPSRFNLKSENYLTLN